MLREYKALSDDPSTNNIFTRDRFRVRATFTTLNLGKMLKLFMFSAEKCPMFDLKIKIHNCFGYAKFLVSLHLYKHVKL